MKKRNILTWETLICQILVIRGEKEETGYRFWLSDLNGVCDINGHTDVLSVLTSTRTDGSSSVVAQVNTPDDDSTIFVDLDELPYKVVKEILNQVRQ